MCTSREAIFLAMINFRGQLTRYTEGSVHELWTISYPLILSMMSVNVMIFLDRLILAHYDTRAMNAAVVAWITFSIFQFGTMGIAAISEVFVGQYNGAAKSKQMGEPVWQMIWFSVLTGFLFIPIGLFAGAYLIPNPDYMADGIPFFKTLMLFGPTFPLVAALSSFFVGRGQVKLVMSATILSNLFNIVLDFVLIFGVDDLLPAMGAKGAAIATGVAQSLQALVLFGLFLQKQYREKYATNCWRFKPSLFMHIFRVGLPASLSYIFDAIAWSVLAQFLASVSEGHLTVYTIGDSFFVLFGFGFLGLQKGVTTVAANYIGANREEILGATLRSGIKIILALMIVLMIPLFLFPDNLAQFFLKQDSVLVVNEELKDMLHLAMAWLWVYFLLDGIAWLFSGILTAAGDTKYVMLISGVGPWIFSILPTYFCVRYWEGSPIITWIICAIYGLLNALCFYLRYKTKRWDPKLALHILR